MKLETVRIVEKQGGLDPGCALELGKHVLLVECDPKSVLSKVAATIMIGNPNEGSGRVKIPWCVSLRFCWILNAHP